MSEQKGNRLFTRVLDTVGDGSGDFQATGDYSETPTEFCIKPSSDDGESELVVFSGAFHWRQDGKEIPTGGYGTKDDPLVNGIQAFIRHEGVITTHFMAGGAVHQNSGWALSATTIHEHPGKGKKDLASFTAGYEFMRTWGSQIILVEGKDELVFLFNDDFTDFEEQFIVVHGYDRRKRPIT